MNSKNIGLKLHIFLNPMECENAGVFPRRCLDAL
jgi:hypothetical protein